MIRVTKKRYDYIKIEYYLEEKTNWLKIKKLEQELDELNNKQEEIIEINDLDNKNAQKVDKLYIKFNWFWRKPNWQWYEIILIIFH